MEKTKKLTEDGWFVIRIRESPLTIINEHDIIVNNSVKMSDLKEAVNKVLLLLNSKFELKLDLSEYLVQTSFSNKTAADDYIKKCKTNSKKSALKLSNS